MPRFRFRLQKLLDYRRLQEKWAKDAWLDAQRRRIDVERDIDAVRVERTGMMESKPLSLADHQALERYLTRLDDQERAHQALVAILEDEEEEARQAWLAARQEAHALEILREGALADWKKFEEREEQKALDEWAVLRRVA
ncbi:MAG: flagellar export protein FliJ [Armatimonadetes bacterium]|nr:flagellar export protein FliJ [Armatimonadota bacterium]